MTDRIPLDDMTDDALDALYERLEAAEATVVRVTHAVMNQSYLVSLDEAIGEALTPAQRPIASTTRTELT